MEGPVSRESASPKFKGFEDIFEKFLHKQLPFSEAQRLADVQVVDNPDSWISVTRGKAMEVGDRDRRTGISSEAGP